MSYKEKISKDLIQQINVIAKKGVNTPLEIQDYFSKNFINLINDNRAVLNKFVLAIRYL